MISNFEDHRYTLYCYRLLCNIMKYVVVSQSIYILKLFILGCKQKKGASCLGVSEFVIVVREKERFRFQST